MSSAVRLPALGDLSAETRRLVNDFFLESRAHPNPQGGFAPIGVQRDITTSLGLVWYDLRKIALNLIPVITPLLNMTPRVQGNGDVATRWKAVTALNTGNLRGGIPEGQRSATVGTTVQQKFSPYATIGLDDFVTFEAQSAAQGFEDERARTAMRLLWSTKLMEEFNLLGGNGPATGSNGDGVALGQPTGLSSSAAATGGSFLDSTEYYYTVVALTLDGYHSAVSNGLATGVNGLVSLTGADGLTYSYGGGSSRVAATANITTSANAGANTGTLSLSCTAITGAYAYAWYCGASSTTMYLGAITTINSVVLTAPPSSSNQVSTALSTSTDRSVNAYTFAGLLTLCANYGSVTALATGTPGTGTVLTASGNAGVTQIDTVLYNMWNTYQLSPTHMIMNAQEAKNINNRVIAGGGTPLFRFNIDGGALTLQDMAVTGNRRVGAYFNNFTPDGGRLMEMIIHPQMPPGTILFATTDLPGYYPDNETGKLWEMHTRRDYYEIDWPVITRKYPLGIYAEETVAHYFPQGTLAMLTNIANG